MDMISCIIEGIELDGGRQKRNLFKHGLASALMMTEGLAASVCSEFKHRYDFTSVSRIFIVRGQSSSRFRHNTRNSIGRAYAPQRLALTCIYHVRHACRRWSLCISAYFFCIGSSLHAAAIGAETEAARLGLGRPRRLVRPTRPTD